MYSETNLFKQAGDHGSVGEELLNDGSDLERRCVSVEKVISENIFPPKKALSLYNVSIKEYLAYLLLKSEHSKELPSLINQPLFYDAISAILGLFDITNVSLNHKEKRVMAGLKEITSHSY